MIWRRKFAGPAGRLDAVVRRATDAPQLWRFDVLDPAGPVRRTYTSYHYESAAAAKSQASRHMRVVIGMEPIGQWEEVQ